MTEPDQALTLREMLQMHANGTLQQWGKMNDYYEELEDVPPELRPGFDLTDYDDIKDELNEIEQKYVHSTTTEPEEEGGVPEGNWERAIDATDRGSDRSGNRDHSEPTGSGSAEEKPSEAT